MAGYLLLRNNKESGPFSLQQLVAMSLKPYDLVWIEGKSAAWRYPGEIEELKGYAPPVEEQPYDRFFKKPQQSSPEATATEKNVKIAAIGYTPGPAVNTDTSGQWQPATEKQEAPLLPGGKRVFITMPVKEPMVAATEAPKKEPVFEKQLLTTPVDEAYTREAGLPKAYRPEPLILEEKYSMPLDDIKQLYVENILRKTEKKSKRFKPTGSVVMLLAVTAFFVLAIVAGTFISGKKENIAQLTPPASDESSTGSVGNSPESSADVTDLVVVTGNADISKKAPAIRKENPIEQVNLLPPTPPQSKNAIAIENPAEETMEEAENVSDIKSAQELPVENGEPVQATIPAVNTNASTIKTEQEPPAVNVNNVVNQPVKNAGNHSAAVDAEKMGTKKKIKKLVVIDKVDFKTGLLGGIRQASVSLSNHSNYKMDLVIVDVDYLKANENTIKTERLYFKNLQPDATITLEAPTGQGTKIDCRITLISSKELDYLFATIN